MGVGWGPRGKNLKLEAKDHYICRLNHFLKEIFSSFLRTKSPLTPVGHKCHQCKDHVPMPAKNTTFRGGVKRNSLQPGQKIFQELQKPIFCSQPMQNTAEHLRCVSNNLPCTCYTFVVAILNIPLSITQYYVA